MFTVADRQIVTSHATRVVGSANEDLTDHERKALRVVVRDDSYTAGEVLAEVVADGTAKVFTFSSPVDLVWVRVDDGLGRADPFGGTPAEGVGIPCDDGSPVPLTIRTSTLKVYAPGNSRINVWGFRFA